jgi:predicted DCC family thiol-disulfide oxidoreductase YuxK
MRAIGLTFASRPGRCKPMDAGEGAKIRVLPRDVRPIRQGKPADAVGLIQPSLVLSAFPLAIAPTWPLVHLPLRRPSAYRRGMAQPADQSPKATALHSVAVWFDGGCPLCRREIALIRRLDWRERIAFVDVAAPGSACPIDRAALLARFHAGENGVMLSGAAAFAAMWRAVPLLWPLGQIARLPLVLLLLERAYLAFLRIRPRLQARLR